MEKGAKEDSMSEMPCGKDSTGHAVFTGFEDGRGPWAKEQKSPLEPSEGVWPCLHFDFSPVRLLLDF